MKSQKPDQKPAKKQETATDLKAETQKDQGTKKGYNEKNPTQPEGAFKPDAASKKN